MTASRRDGGRNISARAAGLTATLALLVFHPQAMSPQRESGTNSLRTLNRSLGEISDRVSASVVQVQTLGYGPLAGDDDSVPAALLAPLRGSGSGVIVDPAGYIVTNAHVVEGARSVRVVLALPDRAEGEWHSILKPRGRRIPARILGVDRETDLALLKIEASDLPSLELGDSDTVRQGQIVLAFGSPLGLENSVTLGVISSVARQLRPEDPMIYIQTDAPINPGNSGGPLVDAEGRVIGINTLILSQSGGSEGIGFAAPSNIVRYVVDELRKNGHVHRGQIGVVGQTVTPALAEGLGLPQDWGVILSDVEPRGPADVSGLRPGDLVLSLDGKTMENARQFQVNLYRKPVGSLVELEFLRGPEKLTRRVTVLGRSDDPERFADFVSRETNLVPELGVFAVTVDGLIRRLLPPLRKLEGVLVTSRAIGAEGRGFALYPGDVIYSLNQTPTPNLEALRQSLAGVEPSNVAVLQIERRGRLVFVTLEME
jgi:serine protease Do